MVEYVQMKNEDVKITDRGNGTWILEEEEVRFFLVEGRKKAALIDTGMHCPEARRIAEKLTKRPLMLINTHADADHISGNDAFNTACMSPHEFAHYMHTGEHHQKLIPLFDGDIIDLGERNLEVIDMPGHTPGSIALLDQERRVVYSGDPIQKHGRIFMFGRERSTDAWLYSLERLNMFTDEFDELWPSHGDLPVEPAMIQKLIDDMHALQEGRISWQKEVIHDQTVRAYDTGDNVLLLDDCTSEERK
jgi:hydroxyacylglutathione hydrolase